MSKISQGLKSNKANVLTIILCALLTGGAAVGLWTPQEAQQATQQTSELLQVQVDALAQNQSLLSATVLALTQNSSLYGEFIDLLVQNQTALNNWLTFHVNPSFYTTSNPYNYIASALPGVSSTYFVVQNCSVGTPVYVVAGQWYTLSSQQAGEIAVGNATTTATGGGSVFFNSADWDGLSLTVLEDTSVTFSQGCTNYAYTPDTLANCTVHDEPNGYVMEYRLGMPFYVGGQRDFNYLVMPSTLQNSTVAYVAINGSTGLPVDSLTSTSDSSVFTNVFAINPPLVYIKSGSYASALNVPSGTYLQAENGVSGITFASIGNGAKICSDSFAQSFGQYMEGTFTVGTNGTHYLAFSPSNQIYAFSASSTETIQFCIDNSISDSLIKIRRGYYQNCNLLVDKALTISGESSSRYDSANCTMLYANSGTVIRVTSPRIMLEHLRISLSTNTTGKAIRIDTDGDIAASSFTDIKTNLGQKGIEIVPTGSAVSFTFTDCDFNGAGIPMTVNCGVEATDFILINTRIRNGVSDLAIKLYNVSGFSMFGGSIEGNNGGGLYLKRFNHVYLQGVWFESQGDTDIYTEPTVRGYHLTLDNVALWSSSAVIPFQFRNCTDVRLESCTNNGGTTYSVYVADDVVGFFEKMNTFVNPVQLLTNGISFNTDGTLTFYNATTTTTTTYP